MGNNDTSTPDLRRRGTIVRLKCRKSNFKAFQPRVLCYFSLPIVDESFCLNEGKIYTKTYISVLVLEKAWCFRSMMDIVGLLEQMVDVSNVLVSSKDRRVSVKIDPSRLKDVIRTLKQEGFTHLSAITGLEVEDGIELLYHLSRGRVILTLSVKIPSDVAVVQSITDVIPGAALYEREIHDLLGVEFEGHPELKRLILPDDWPEGSHPLRKQKHGRGEP